jgi:hypothetical protein
MDAPSQNKRDAILWHVASWGDRKTPRDIITANPALPVNASVWFQHLAVPLVMGVAFSLRYTSAMTTNSLARFDTFSAGNSGTEIKTLLPEFYRCTHIHSINGRMTMCSSVRSTNAMNAAHGSLSR